MRTLVALMAVFFVLLSMGISHIITSDIPLPSQETVSNTAALGAVLYTQYALPLQIAGLLLVTSVIAAVVLTFTGKLESKSRR